MPTVEGSATIDGQALRVAASYTVNTTPQINEFSDFTSGKAGLQLPAVRAGGGRIYRMVPMTSTKAAEVAAIPSMSPNLYTLLTTGGNSSAQVMTGIDHSDYTLEGTPQGHSYHGLRVGWSTGAQVRRLRITGIPGTSGMPPEETFSMSLWHANGSLVEDVTVDGLGLAATLFGLNGTNGSTIRRCRATGNRAGMALASWQSGNVHVEDFDTRGSVRPINIERPTGPHTFVRVDMRQQQKRYLVTVNTHAAAGYPDSVPVKIIEPILDASQLPLRVGVTTQPYLGKPQTQKTSDIQVIMGGVDVSRDTSKVIMGDVW